MALLHQPFPMPGHRRAQAWRYHPAFRRPRHFHDEPEINVVLAGTATFAIGADQHHVRAGTVLWFPPGLDHFLTSADAAVDLFVVGFQPALLAAFAREHGAPPRFARAPCELAAGSTERWRELLARAPDSADDVAVERHLLGLLRELGATVPEPPAAPALELGYRTAEALLTSPDASREDLARRLASNRGDVSRRFRAQQGMSLSDYKNRLRLLRFLDRLASGSGNLTRAALEAGFGSYAQCHRTFRALLGASPSEYRRAELRATLANRFEPLSGGARGGA